MAQRKKKGLALDNDSFSLTSMIDIIFLLLIYFMYLPIQQEADMTVQLPVQTEPTETTTLPSEQVVLIKPDGSIFLNGSYIEDAPILKAQTENKTPPHEFTSLATTLTRLKKANDGGGRMTVVTIIPDGDAPHQASMFVLSACAKAGIKQVSFSDAI